MSASRYVRNRHRRHALTLRAQGAEPLSARAFARDLLRQARVYPANSVDPHAVELHRQAKGVVDWMAAKGMGL